MTALIPLALGALFVAILVLDAVDALAWHRVQREVANGR